MQLDQSSCHVKYKSINLNPILKKTNAKHSRLCEIKYPYTLIAESNNVRATRFRNCTLNSVMVEDKEVVQTLGYEANMDLISIGEFDALMGDNDKFGTYCGLPGMWIPIPSWRLPFVCRFLNNG